MKPYLNYDNRLTLKLHRSGLKTTLGSMIELDLAWKKLLRDIERLMPIGLKWRK